MMEGFTRTEIKTSGARIVTVHGGKGPPVLLMHGNPFTHLSWHKFAPRLAQEFTVVATDLRGYGDSEKPPGGPDHSGYSFRAMAQDQVEVMAALGFTRFMAAGHDRGARVLHRMCLDHPGKVERAAILDIVPQHHLFNNITQAWATYAYHWFFMIQPEPMPETLMSADPDFYITKKLAKTAKGLSFFGKEALEEYKRCFRNPETVHAMCEDYRATATVDLAMDTKDFAAGKKVTTIEGLSADGSHPVQRAWKECNVPQCGYCQSGQIMQAVSLLKKKPKPTDADIDREMQGNICRCGTYQRIRKAILIASGVKA